MSGFHFKEIAHLMDNTDRYQAGQLDRKVMLSLPVISVDSTTKYETATYPNDVVMSAMVTEESASKEAEVNGGVLYDGVISVLIRFRSEYKTTNVRLEYEGIIYDVLSCREIGRRQWLIYKCKYGGKEL